MKKPVLFSKYIGAVSKEVLGEDLIKPHPVMIELECLYRDCLEEIKSKLNSLDVSNGVVIIVTTSIVSQAGISEARGAVINPE